MRKREAVEQHPKGCDCADCVKKAEAASASAYGALQRKGAKESRKALPFRSIASLSEASSVDRQKREIRCMVIREGLGNMRDRHYYGPESIQAIAEVLPGSQSYINHPTQRQLEERPEGDVHELCGYWKDAGVIEGTDGRKGVMATLCCDPGAAGDEALAKAEHAIAYAKEFPGLTEVYAGLSINGDGETEPRDIEVDGEDLEVLYVTTVTECGADVVTKPAREGRFLGLLESMRNATDPKEVRAMAKNVITEALRKIEESKTQLTEKKIEQAAHDTVVAAELAKIKAATVESDKGKKKTTEADDEEADDEVDEAADGETGEGMRAAGDDDEEQPDGGNAGDGKKGGKTTITRRSEERMTKTESATVRDLRKQLAESVRTNKALKARTVEAEVKAMVESGVDEKVARALVALPKEHRDAFEAVLGSIQESAPFGGATQRGLGKITESDPGAAFTRLLGDA